MYKFNSVWREKSEDVYSSMSQSKIHICQFNEVFNVPFSLERYFPEVINTVLILCCQVFSQPFRLQGYDPCTYDYSVIYFNRPDVQKAMHANTTGIPYPWTGCNIAMNVNWQDTAITVLPIYRELLAAGLRLWVYRYFNSTSLKLNH